LLSYRNPSTSYALTPFDSFCTVRWLPVIFEKMTFVIRFS
jgi:hypothetical protein